jgi:hypothetical protein
MKYIKKTFVLFFVAALGLSGCHKEFASKGIPTNKLVASTYYQNAAELRAATANLYTTPWWSFNENSQGDFIVFVGDLLSGNAVAGNAYGPQFTNFSINTGFVGLDFGWQSLYDVIGQSNTTMLNIQSYSPASLGSAKTGAIAEARFMRAIAYFYLVQLWGPVPIVDNSTSVVATPLLNTNIPSDVYKFIISDLHYAAQNLPATDPQAGRVTKWSAEGLLAKVFLTKSGITGTRVQADLDSAKYWAGDVVNNSGLSLFPSYYDAFLTKNNNNPEMLFGLQFTVSPTAGWGTNDVRETCIEGDPNIDGVGGGGWDGMAITKDLYDAFVASPGDLRRKATFMLKDDNYPELITAANPNGYLDTNRSSAYVKKYVDGGPLANNGANITLMHDASPNYLLRLSDVYLVYAEAILGTNGSTSDPEALKYFNLIRTRAGVPTKTSLTWLDIFNERRLELALEYQFWFDLKRWSDYDQTAAAAFIAKQHRNTFTYVTGTVTEPAGTPVGGTNVVAKWTLPYPAAEVSSDPLLTKTPVPYYK